MKYILLFCLLALIPRAMNGNHAALIESNHAQAKEYTDNKNYHEAIKLYDQCLTLDPYDIQATIRSGLAYIALNQLFPAEQYFRRAMTLNDEAPCLQYNLAFILRRIGKFHEAIELYEKVIACNFRIEESHFGLANAYLVLGNFEKGLPAYEISRSKSVQIHDRLQNIEQLSGKSILIIEEWGIGDTLHFIRYAQQLKKAGATKIILAVRSALIPFFSLQPCIDQVVSSDQAFEINVDYRIPMMSLMFICNTRLETIQQDIPDIPYLYADPQLIDSWKEKINNDPHIKVGLFWQSETNSEKNMPLKTIASLCSISGISFYSLQKNSSHEFPQISNDLIKFVGADFDIIHGSFMDSAALIKNLDLVITIDTSIAHLAGALGIPTWLMIPHFADWRWFLDRSDSPWYPTMKIFRQKISGDWDGVIQEIAQELKKIVGTK